MNNGWIKVHRKVLDNGILLDQTAWCIFSWLLLKVDRNTGKKTIGRFWASEELGIKPTTFYQALRRLEKKWKVLTQESNNRFTEISLINWSKYQSNDNSDDNKMTTDRQQNDTLQEDKNIRIKEAYIEPPKEINSLSLTKGQVMAFLKEFPGMTSIELKEQAVKCSSYMAMSSSKYTNPGLFFRGWMQKEYTNWKAKKRKEQEELEKQKTEIKLTPEQIQNNFKRLSELKSKYKIGGEI